MATMQFCEPRWDINSIAGGRGGGRGHGYHAQQTGGEGMRDDQLRQALPPALYEIVSLLPMGCSVREAYPGCVCVRVSVLCVRVLCVRICEIREGVSE